MTNDGFKETRRTMERAIRRLNALEYAMLLAAAFFALAGGAVVAFLLAPAGISFRVSWAVASLLLFLIPAAGVARREAGKERRAGDIDKERRNDEANGGR